MNKHEHTEKCIFYSLGIRLKDIVQQIFTNLAIFMFLIHKTVSNNNNSTSPIINYKNAFGIMNLNNFLVKRPVYVKVVLSLTVIRINSALS